MNEPDKPSNPFEAFESDRTIIKPGAGARPRAPAAEPVTVSGVAPARAQPEHGTVTGAGAGSGAGAWLPRAEQALAELPAHASLNPLVQAAASLLAAAPRLRAMPRHPNPAGLRQALVEAVQRFEASARALSLPNEQVVAARYVLCTLLDEAAASTPWGSGWSSQSLLVQFHNEAWGGEKVFQLLTRLAENPAQHRNLLELVYIALSLGFEGRYRVLDQGRAQLDSLRQRLAQMLGQLAGAPEPALSTQWRGLAAAPRRLRDGIPLWVWGVAAAVLLLLVFLALRLSLGAQTDPGFAALQGLDVRAAPAAAAPPPSAVPVPPRLAQLLKADIAAGAVQVQDLADRSVVTVLGDTLFDSGSGDVVARAEPLFGRIAAALNQLPGRVVVSGHTDNQAIRSLRYPSNWHLSVARAQSVLRLLAGTVAPARLSAEGRAELEPVADNSRPEGRARNRRVEITLTVAAAS